MTHNLEKEADLLDERDVPAEAYYENSYIKSGRKFQYF